MLPHWEGEVTWGHSSITPHIQHMIWYFFIFGQREEGGFFISLTLNCNSVGVAVCWLVPVGQGEDRLDVSAGQPLRPLLQLPAGDPPKPVVGRPVYPIVPLAELWEDEGDSAPDRFPTVEHGFLTDKKLFLQERDVGAAGWCCDTAALQTAARPLVCRRSRLRATPEFKLAIKIFTRPLCPE